MKLKTLLHLSESFDAVTTFNSSGDGEELFNEMVKALKRAGIKGEIEIQTKTGGKLARKFFADEEQFKDAYSEIPKILKQNGFSSRWSYGAYSSWINHDLGLAIQMLGNSEFRIAPRGFLKVAYLGTSQGSLHSILEPHQPDDYQ